MADKTHRPPPSAQGAAQSSTSIEASGAAAQSIDPRLSGAGGNAYAAERLAAKQSEGRVEETPAEPGIFDKLGAVLGSSHLKAMLGATGKGVQWDDKEDGANRMEVDVWGKDEVRVPKLRIAKLAKEGISAANVKGDGIKLREGPASSKGKYTADLSVPTIGASDIASKAPELRASAIGLSGVKVHRELDEASGGLVDFFSKPGSTTVQIDAASVSGLRTPDLSADRLSAENLVGVGNGTTHQLGIGRAQASGVSAGDAHVGSASASKISAAMGPGGVRYGVDSVAASGIRAGTGAGAISLADASVRGGAAEVSAAGTTASANRVVGSGIAVGGARAKTVGVDGLSISAAPSGGSGVTAKAKSATVAGVTAGDVSVDEIGAKGLSGRLAPNQTAVNAQSLTATGVAGPGFGASGAQAQGVSASTVKDVTSVRASRLDAQALRASGATATSASIEGAAGRFGDGPGTLSATGLSAKGAAFGDVGAQTTNASNVTATLGDNQRLTAQTLNATEVRAARGTAARVGLTGATASIGATGTALSAKTAEASGIAAGDATVKTATARNIDVGVSGSTGTLAADGLGLTGVHAGGVGIDSVGVTGVRAKTGPSGSDATAKTAKTTRLSAGSGAIATHIGTTDARDVSVSHADGVTRGAVGAAEATGLQAGDLRAASLGVTNGNGTFGPDGAAMSAAGARATGIVDGALSISSASATGLTTGTAGGTTRLAVDSGAATDIHHTGFDVKSAGAKKASMTLDAAGVRGTAGSIDAAGMTFGSSSLTSAGAARAAFDNDGGVTNASAGKLTASGLVTDSVQAGSGSAQDAKVRFAGGSTDASAASASTTDFRAGSFGARHIDAANLTAKATPNASGFATDIGASQASARDVSVDVDGVSVRVGAVSAGPTGVKTGQAPSPARAVAPIPQQAAALVDDASIKAQAPLNAQTMGSGKSRFTVKPGTTAYVEVQIVDGQIVPSGTAAKFSTPLDTWAWTKVPGVYLTEEGKLYADVSGMFDPNLSKEANAMIGGSGDRMNLSVAGLAKQMFPTPAPVAPTTAVTAARTPVAADGAGSAAAAKSAPATGAARPVLDPNEIRAQGTVGLNAGTFDVGGMNATLAPGNVATVDLDAGYNLTVNFSTLVLDALGIATDTVKVDIKNVNAENTTATMPGSPD